jgi:hypothetical protein
MYKNNYIKIVFISLMFLMGAACTSRKPKLDKENLIPEKELISVLIDIHITDGLLAIPRINYDYAALDSITTYYHVIEKHGYTKELFDNTIKYYFISKPKQLNKIYDRVLVRLSEMEANIDKEMASAPQKEASMWEGKDFYSSPSMENDSANFAFKLDKPGYYKLSFNTLVYPDDQTVDPAASIYYVAADSISTGKKHYLKPVTYIKDGFVHTYFFTLVIPMNTSRHYAGSLFYSENHSGLVEKHYKVDDILLTYSLMD